MAKNATREMTSGSPVKLILSFAVPLLLGMLFQQFYSMVDTIIVGKSLGVDQLAGVGSTGAINFMIIGFCNGVCSGFAIPIAQSFGAKDYKRLRKFVANAAWLSIAFAAVMTVVVCVLCRQILSWMDTPENIFEYAYSYIFIIFLGIPATYLYNLLSGIIRSLGDSRTPVIFLVISATLNILFDLLAILVLHMGVAGAALATLGSRVFSAIVVLWLLRSPKNEIAVKDYLTIRPDGTQIGMILKIGIPSGVENSMFQFGKLAIQSTVSTMGTVAIAAQAMTNILENLNGVAAIGIGIGLMTVVGECMGAGRKDEAVYYVKKLSVIAEVIIIICCGAIFLLTKPITTLGGMEPESASLCFHMITWITIVKPIVWTAAFIPAYGLRAAGDVKFSMIISCLTMWLCRVSLCIFLSRHFGMGPMAVWIGMFSDWTLRGIFFGIRFHSRKWLEKKVIQ